MPSSVATGKNVYVAQRCVETNKHHKGGRVVECSLGLSIEVMVVQSHLLLFRNLSSFIHPHICLCLSEETKCSGPFYMVSMPGEIKDPTHGVKV